MNQPNPSLFYFASAAQLEGFERFDVIEAHAVHSGEAVSFWTVTAYEKSTGQNTAIADFHAQGMAETFRDMCVIVSKAAK